MPEGTVKTSIVLPAELHWDFKRAAAERKLADTAAVREALRRWIAAPEGAGPAPVTHGGKNADYHAMLDRALETEDAQTIKQLLRMATRSAAQPVAKAKKAG